MTGTESPDISFLYPHLFGIDQTVGDVHADLTRMLRIVDHAIAMAEKHAPHLPELPLLRARRKELLGSQRAVAEVSEYFQDQLVVLEDGFARRAGLVS
jgi:hypothetical protein